MYYIYKITNRTNNKIYIGKTLNVSKRFLTHIRIANGGKTKYKQFSYIHQAIKKYGKENFATETVDQYDSEKEAFIAEIKLIKELNSIDRKVGYNLTNGGEGSSGIKRGPMSQEHKDKLSKANKGQKNPKGKNHWAYGKKATLSHRINHSKNNGTRKLSTNDIDAIKNHLTEGKLSQKDIAKLFRVNQSVISRIKNKQAHHIQ